MLPCSAFIPSAGRDRGVLLRLRSLSPPQQALQLCPWTCRLTASPTPAGRAPASRAHRNLPAALAPLSRAACSATLRTADAPPRGGGRRRLPSFDVKQMVAKTKSAAQWMHFAPSNLFTAEIAPRAQALLEAGLMETGIIGVEAWDEEIVSKVMQ